MDFLRGLARCSRLEEIRNNVIREKNIVKIPVLDYIRYKQLNWCGHVQRMDHRRIIEWCPPGRRRKGRSRNSWMQEAITGMRERGIGDLEWVDREGWRIKVYTLGRERCENLKNLYININKNK